MEIFVNGRPHTIPAECSVAQLLDELKLSGRLATEINREIVPSGHYVTRQLRSGDRVEIIRAVGGG
ncbi:MAG: sulfur carrier protein ThiS [Pseudomonadota bacterium]